MHLTEVVMSMDPLDHNIRQQILQSYKIRGIYYTYQPDPMPRYFARLEAAEKVCEYVEQFGCSNGAVVGDLLLAWRKVKEASEAYPKAGGAT